MTLQIPLTQGKFATVDDVDFEYLHQFNWFAKPADQRRENWYACRTKNATTIYMHREISAACKGVLTDHADGDGLNNIRKNLRLCNRVLNNANTRDPMPKSGYRGVYAANGKWLALAYHEGNAINLGRFADPADAAKARDNFVTNLYGKFAVLNFPKLENA